MGTLSCAMFPSFSDPMNGRTFYMGIVHFENFVMLNLIVKLYEWIRVFSIGFQKT
jgi:hypothetical protein